MNSRASVVDADVDAAVEYTVSTQTRMRRAIGARVRESAQTIPHVTLHRQCDAAGLLAARRSDGKSNVTMSALLAAVVSRVVAKHPTLNGLCIDGEVRNYHMVNLGVAVAVDGGLVVPVLRDCTKLSLQQTANRLADLVSRARAGKLRPPELGGGTFTLTNLGNYGVEYFTPIINAPQLAILGVGSTSDKVFVRDGVVTTQPAMHLSLSFDHAAIDGAPAAAMLADVACSIEQVNAMELSVA